MGKATGSPVMTANASWVLGLPASIDSPTPEAWASSGAEGSGQHPFSGRNIERLALPLPVICVPQPSMPMPMVSPLLSHLYHSGSHAEPGPGLQSLGNHGAVVLAVASLKPTYM